ncbi:MAG TPA: class I SAM-dependent methyltransferase, partial [Chitinophagaceae bacterium]
EGREDYLLRKKDIIEYWLNELPGLTSALDAGGNDGTFSKLISSSGTYVVTADSDHFAINKLYEQATNNNNIHPLIIDFSNPSPYTGVNNKERVSFLNRKHFDLVISLAFIHHLCIGKNIPFEFIAEMFKRLGKILIIEFIPKEDEKVQQMLQYRTDIYDWYIEENFRKQFEKFFVITERKEIGKSKRILYLMITNESNHS